MRACNVYLCVCECVCVHARVRMRACACVGIEDALPLCVLPPRQTAKLFVHLGGLEGRFGRLSRPVPVHA